jgi:hypothetical protein
MNIDEYLEVLAGHWERATITQRVLMRRIFRHYGRMELIPN